MLELVQGWFYNLIHGSEILMYIETYYSSLSDFNRILLVIGLGIVFIIGLFQIFKKILKMTSGIIKFLCFAVILYYLASVLFNI